jgi:1-deoxy-D-xylulose-5-phosphate reductoisomerase
MKSLLVLGSTGSIGKQTLDVIRAQPASLRVEGLSARNSWKALAAQAREFRPRFVAVEDEQAAAHLKVELDPSITLLSGPQALVELCTLAHYDTAVHGVVGAVGLQASVAVLERGADLALANKESLVMAGQELMAIARRTGGAILPVDSELCAIFQCLRGERLERVRCVHLTASGGPFRDTPVEQLEHSSRESALRHPTWSMGPRITIGSATLMNKALEVIEVHHLFGVAPVNIRVWIHRQSIVHSMVEFVDGSLIAQMGPPDMRGPLHYCLFHPDRAPANMVGFDLGLFSRLSFEAVDAARFPALELGFDCARRGGDAGAVLNAADEVAVEAFLAERANFGQIVRTVKTVLARRASPEHGVRAALAADADARQLTREALERAPAESKTTR